MKRKLTVVAKPREGEDVIVLNVSAGGMKGDGPVDLVCGVCAEVLAAGVPDQRLHHLTSALLQRAIEQGGVGVSGPGRAVVLRCPTCGAFNEAS